jgi:hypothetical protein
MSILRLTRVLTPPEQEGPQFTDLSSVTMSDATSIESPHPASTESRSSVKKKKQLRRSQRSPQPKANVTRVRHRKRRSTAAYECDSSSSSSSSIDDAEGTHKRQRTPPAEASQDQCNGHLKPSGRAIAVDFPLEKLPAMPKGNHAQVSFIALQDPNCVRVVLARAPALITPHRSIAAVLQHYLPASWRIAVDPAAHAPVIVQLREPLPPWPASEPPKDAPGLIDAGQLAAWNPSRRLKTRLWSMVTQFVLPGADAILTSIAKFRKKPTRAHGRDVLAAVRGALFLKRLTLKRHQQALKAHFRGLDWTARPQRPRQGLVHEMLWNMGSGKTAASLEATVGTDDGRPPQHVLVLCDITTIGGFVDTARRTVIGKGLDGRAPYQVTVDIAGEARFQRDFMSLVKSADLLILDEVQRFRKAKAAKRDMLFQLAGQMSSMLLLSGTPLVNSGIDLLGLLILFREDIRFDEAGTPYWDGLPLREESASDIFRLVFGHHKNDGRALQDLETFELPPDTRAQLTRMFPVEKLAKVFQNRVSYFDPAVHGRVDSANHFPTVHRETVRVTVGPCLALEYVLKMHSEVRLRPLGAAGAEASLQRFRTNAKNSLRSEELGVLTSRDPMLDINYRGEAIAAYLEEHGEDIWPVVVHCERLEDGVDAIRETLARVRRGGRRIRMGEITSRIARAKDRQAVIEDFEAGRIDLLLISPTAAVGTNIRGAHCFFRDPQKNRSSENQTDGRVIRLDSHPGGAKEHVRLVKTVCCFPQELTTMDPAAATRLAAAMSPAEKLFFVEELIGFFDEARMRWERSLLLKGAWDKAFWASAAEATEFRRGDRVLSKSSLPSNTDALIHHMLCEIQRLMVTHRNGLTVHEELEWTNFAKHLQVQEYTAVLQRASIPMPMGTMTSALPSHLTRDDIQAALRFRRQQQCDAACGPASNSNSSSSRGSASSALVAQVLDHVSSRAREVKAAMKKTIEEWDAELLGMSAAALPCLKELFMNPAAVDWLETPSEYLVKDEAFISRLMYHMFQRATVSQLRKDDQAINAQARAAKKAAKEAAVPQAVPQQEDHGAMTRGDAVVDVE